jgi:REP element-mobilizing transposase RayT
MPHDTRPEHARRHPVHVTLRLERGLPSLRRPRTLDLLLRVFRALRVREDFRLVQFSIQTNHLHLIVEAEDRHALSRGMRGLGVRLARRLNRSWRRRGRVLAERYHARALKTPREVRAALVYVLANARRHGIVYAGPDRFASGTWFDGWRGFRATLGLALPPVRAAETWLLRVGWRRLGRIGLREAPRAG